jgi:hypothetical protein
MFINNSGIGELIGRAAAELVFFSETKWRNIPYTWSKWSNLSDGAEVSVSRVIRQKKRLG